MRSLIVVMVVSVGGCTGFGAEPAGSRAAAVTPQKVPTTATESAFAGEWEACEGTTSPEECSRYRLFQRGDRICGTWFHFASGKAYAGRVIAQAISSTDARRTHICGRPSSETETECEEEWQRIDRPLRLCDGKLADLTRADGSCFADYQAVPMADEQRDALLAASWMQACLSGAGD